MYSQANCRHPWGLVLHYKPTQHVPQGQLYWMYMGPRLIIWRAMCTLCIHCCIVAGDSEYLENIIIAEYLRMNCSWPGFNFFCYIFTVLINAILGVKYKLLYAKQITVNGCMSPVNALEICHTTYIINTPNFTSGFKISDVFDDCD